ncbi:hypothetical protein GAY28_11255, partial [Azospirillum brasilense]|nr:hypothetical protein [Azospirillum brasilense]
MSAATFAAPLLAVFLLVSGASVPAAQGLPGLGGGPNPVEVNADQAIEWHQDVRAYVARGNASAKRTDSTVYADVLTAYYREVPGKGNEVFQLLAEGNVRIVSPTQEVFGERGVYDVDKQVAVVTGRNLKLVTRTDIVTARDTLEYYEAKNLTVARGDAVAVRIANGDRLRADILIGQLKKMPDGSTQMERIDGAGSVVVTTATDVALSDKLVYSVADETAVLLGNVKITRNDNQLKGDAAEMNMKTKVNRVIAGPATGGRVMGLLIPGQE